MGWSLWACGDGHVLSLRWGISPRYSEDWTPGCELTTPGCRKAAELRVPLSLVPAGPPAQLRLPPGGHLSRRRAAVQQGMDCGTRSLSPHAQLGRGLCLFSCWLYSTATAGVKGRRVRGQKTVPAPACSGPSPTLPCSALSAVASPRGSGERHLPH